jgi:Ca2+-transporting ATPase
MSAIDSRGLSVDEAARRLALDGPNELPGTRERRLLAIMADVLTEPMLLLLIAAAAIYFILGDAGEATAIAASMLIVIAISIVQERRTERALARLRDLSSPRALVLRDGSEQRIAGRDVVQGDLVVIHEGDRVPADAVLVSAHELSVDESILTGESLPADKSAADASTRNAPEERNRVYSGSLVVRGTGLAQVFATGARSQIGRIGAALDALQTETTPLYREIRQMVKWAAIGGLAVCAVVAATYALTREDWLGGALAGITLAMGLLPEEFPVVLTIFLALGAWRLSRLDVLTRRMPAIETIGAVTVLAVDKTGTLTENRMRVALLEADAEVCDLRTDAVPGPAGARVLSIASAASKIDAFDPMERAIQDAAAALTASDVAAWRQSHLVREYGLTPQLLAVTNVWRRPDADELEVTVKGAPEAVFRLCRLSAGERETRLAGVAALASEGLRVLGVAHGRCADGDLPDSPYSFDLQLVGLICLADPLRADVPAAMNECRRAGIRVVMITGDHPGTAAAIARRAGLADSDAVLTGAELNALDEQALRERARTTSIYARMSPEHKLRLVHTLKANGEIVAMTGDGVNDAPALKAAHVGVAMGGRGTDVAREAASIVLLNDDFASLVAAVRSGRRIYENLRHAMAFIIAVHVPIAGMGLLPVLLGWPLLLYPLHVLVLEFVIDPACTFVFEADEQDENIMDRPPRSTKARLFSGALLRRSFLMGGVILAIAFAAYGLALSAIQENAARALSFVALIGAAVALIFVNRAPDSSFATLLRRPNAVFWVIACGAAIVVAAVLYVPALATAFRFAAPSAPLMLAVLGGASAAVIAAGMLARREPEKVQPARRP